MIMKKSEREPIEPGSILRRMERMMGGAAKGSKNEHAAQDLVYDAWECANREDAFDLLEQAVELDPTNVDAWLGLMDFAPMKSDERIVLLKRLVETGEKNLGKKFFKNNGGYFWGVLETRPYMRARSQLALRLMETGKFEESAVEHEEMLKLNPNDNQGIRYGLMTCYLTLSRLDDAQRLFENYKDDREYSAIFAWAYVLERFLADDLDGAQKALSHAKKQNGHAMAYFLEHRKLPKAMPGSYGIGSREEAVIACDIQASVNDDFTRNLNAPALSSVCGCVGMGVCGMVSGKRRGQGLLSLPHPRIHIPTHESVAVNWSIQLARHISKHPLFTELWIL